MGDVTSKDLHDIIIETRRRFQELAPGAARIVLEHFVGRENLSLPELILEALYKLPVTGLINRKKDNEAVQGISWLIDEVPNTDTRKTEIVRLFYDALQRSKLLKSERR
jgi:hypothetical protein